MTGSRTPKAGLDGWKKARQHKVTLPSGTEVTIQVPNLALLVKTGQLPNELVQQAIGTLQANKLTAEAIAEQADFYAKLVCATVKEPAVTEDDVLGDNPLPFEDVEMLVEIATRQRDLDALGHHIGGLHTSRDWRAFRGVTDVYEAMEGA